MLTITEAEMYWITRLDALQFVLSFTVFVLMVVTIGFVIAGWLLRDQVYETHPSIAVGKRLHRRAVWLFVTAIAITFVYAFVPSTKQYAAIKVIPAIVNSQAVQQDVPELYKLAVEWAKDGLKPKAEKK